MEYQVFYYQPGLGWCLLIDPYPEGTVYRTEAEGREAADRAYDRLKHSVEVWERGAGGSRKVYSQEWLRG
jgi:hypothetical protein